MSRKHLYLMFLVLGCHLHSTTRAHSIPPFEILSYSATLSLDPLSRAFDGQIRINANVHGTVSQLDLDATSITISHAEVAGRRVGAKAVNEHSVRLQFTPPLVPGTASVLIDYRGIVNENGEYGIFKKVVNGDTYFFTQFEPAFASRAFPCVDNPAAKATWRLTIRSPDSDSIVSNTASVSTVTAGSRKTVEFEETPPLPPYAVAFAVGKFSRTSSTRSDPQVNIYFPLNHIGLPELAESAQSIIRQAEVLLSEKLPYRKLDIVVIPDVAKPFAMENAGMITIASSLIEASETSSLDRTRIIAHEIVHQWFGDSLTPASWKDLWLSESMADWIADRIIVLRSGSIDSRLADFMSEWSPNWPSVEPREGIGVDGELPPFNEARGIVVLQVLHDWLGPAEFWVRLRGLLVEFKGSTIGRADFVAAMSSNGLPASLLNDLLTSPDLDHINNGLCGTSSRNVSIGTTRQCETLNLIRMLTLNSSPSIESEVSAGISSWSTSSTTKRRFLFGYSTLKKSFLESPTLISLLSHAEDVRVRDVVPILRHLQNHVSAAIFDKWRKWRCGQVEAMIRRLSDEADEEAVITVASECRSASVLGLATKLLHRLRTPAEARAAALAVKANAEAEFRRLLETQLQGISELDAITNITALVSVEAPAARNEEFRYLLENQDHFDVVLGVLDIDDPLVREDALTYLRTYATGIAARGPLSRNDVRMIRQVIQASCFVPRQQIADFAAAVLPAGDADAAVKRHAHCESITYVNDSAVSALWDHP